MKWKLKKLYLERIAHGILTAGLISAVLGVQLPGPGKIYLGQDLKFTRPVKFGDTITAIVEVLGINYYKNTVSYQRNVKTKMMKKY